MPRDLPLANGRMLVNFDANYDLRDIFRPTSGCVTIRWATSITPASGPTAPSPGSTPTTGSARWFTRTTPSSRR